MKIAYLHGLESTVEVNSPKIIFLKSISSSLYAPQINYRDPEQFNRIYQELQVLRPDVIIGSSMGGYFAYLLGSKLGIKTILFNPAMCGRSFEPVTDQTGLFGTRNYIRFGESDTVIDYKKVIKYFNTQETGHYQYGFTGNGHRVPETVFTEEIQEILMV